MSANKKYAGRIWAVVILMLLILGQARAVSAHQPGSYIQQQQPGCVMQARTDPMDYYPNGQASVPTASHAKWEILCFLDGEASSRELRDHLAGTYSECGVEVRVDPRDYYPIEGTGVPAARTAVWQVVCSN